MGIYVSSWEIYVFQEFRGVIRCIFLEFKEVSYGFGEVSLEFEGLGSLDKVLGV